MRQDVDLLLFHNEELATPPWVVLIISSCFLYVNPSFVFFLLRSQVFEHIQKQVIIVFAWFVLPKLLPPIPDAAAVEVVASLNIDTLCGTITRMNSIVPFFVPKEFCQLLQPHCRIRFPAILQRIPLLLFRTCQEHCEKHSWLSFHQSRLLLPTIGNCLHQYCPDFSFHRY